MVKYILSLSAIIWLFFLSPLTQKIITINTWAPTQGHSRVFLRTSCITNEKKNVCRWATSWVVYLKNWKLLAHLFTCSHIHWCVRVNWCVYHVTVHTSSLLSCQVEAQRPQISMEMMLSSFWLSDLIPEGDAYLAGRFLQMFLEIIYVRTQCRHHVFMFSKYQWTSRDITWSQLWICKASRRFEYFFGH